jgi:hypothetical protein
MTASAAAPEQDTTYPESLELALLAFHRTIGPIRKSSEAKYGKFADLRTVLEAVTPVLAEQGLLLTQTIAASGSNDSNGSCLLITRLVHAPSGEDVSSACPIPTLQELLDRVHQLRSQVLSTYPLDLQLAAIGALPPLLPPRNLEPGSELPPPPQRQPGLRMEDQLKGLYTLLGQLGTTTNPLHGFGGIITYLRRYQVLSILSLAASDDDGESFGGQGSATPAPRALPPQPPAQDAPEPARSRARRTMAPKPQPTPPPSSAANQENQPPAPEQRAQGQPTEPVLQPAPQRAPQAAPQAPASGPSSDSSDQPLSQSEVQGLIALIRTLPTEKVPHLVARFREQFQLPGTALASDYIKTTAHALFIRQQVDALKPIQAAI